MSALKANQSTGDQKTRINPPNSRDSTYRTPIKDTTSTNPSSNSLLLRRTAIKTKPSTKSTLKPVTPESVRALMLIEAVVIGFLFFWLSNEYVNNAFYRTYLNSVLVEHLTTYTIAFGLGIGLAGTAVAATLWKFLRDAKLRLETVAPRIKGSVEKVLAGLPSIEPKTQVPPATPVQTGSQVQGTIPSLAVASPATQPGQEKKKSA